MDKQSRLNSKQMNLPQTCMPKQCFIVNISEKELASGIFVSVIHP